MPLLLLLSDLLPHYFRRLLHISLALIQMAITLGITPGLAIGHAIMSASRHYCQYTLIILSLPISLLHWPLTHTPILYFMPYHYHQLTLWCWPEGAIAFIDAGLTLPLQYAEQLRHLHISCIQLILPPIWSFTPLHWLRHFHSLRISPHITASYYYAIIIIIDNFLLFYFYYRHIADIQLILLHISYYYMLINIDILIILILPLCHYYITHYFAIVLQMPLAIDTLLLLLLHYITLIFSLAISHIDDYCCH